VAPKLHLLIVEDQPDDAELLVTELVRAGYDVQWSRVETMDQMVAALDPEPDIILCDYDLPTMDALDVLRMLADRGMYTPLIVVSGVMDDQTCVDALRLGAADYLLKDRLARLGPAVGRALTVRRLAREARQARREWRETADILGGMVAHAPAAICVKDSSGRYVLSNAEYDRLVGADPGSLPGRTDVEAFGPELARRLSERDRQCLDRASVVEQQETFDVDGRERTYLSVGYPVVDGTGQVFAVGAIYLDITRQKGVEEELRAAQVQLQARADELDEANAELRELDRLKTDFVASVSHELRTPLTSICGYSEMLGDGSVGELGEVERRMIGVINRNSHRLLSLIEDLLILSRIDSGVYALQDEQVDIADVIRVAGGVLRPALTTAGVTFEVVVDDELRMVPGDRSQLERLMLNLLSNGVKFSLRGGRVTVRAWMEGEQLAITVADTGIGIPAQDMPKLFTRFYRSGEARQRSIPGTGLGLAVVQGIVEGHRGSIAVDSTQGQGTIVTVRLPGTRPLPELVTVPG